MRKAELEECYGAYTAQIGCINNHLSHGEFHAAFQACLQTLEHLVPALQYIKRYGDDQNATELVPLSAICTYGPPLFEHDGIERAREFVGSTKQLLKHPANYIGALDAAIEMEEVARLAWNAIEERPGTEFKSLCLHLDADEAIVRAILDMWARLRIVNVVTNLNGQLYQLRTHVDAEADAICPECGAHGRGRKGLLFAAFGCKRCKHHGHYHIVYPDH